MTTVAYDSAMKGGTRTAAAARLAAWIAFVAAALAALHAAGHGPLAPPPLDGGRLALQEWLDQRGPAAASFAVLRMAAVVLGWYLLGTTLASTVLRLVNAGRAASLAEALALPAVRRLTRAAAGVGLAAGALAVTGGLTAPARPALAGEAGAVTMRRLPDPGPMPTMRRLGDEPMATTTTTVVPPPVEPPPATWTVRPGDHFWRIAEEVLTESWHRPPTDEEVTPYWARLVDHNRPGLADPDDPDLLFPGQQIVILPPPQVSTPDPAG
jgi:nucleoid-associated protein YgaU